MNGYHKKFVDDQNSLKVVQLRVLQEALNRISSSKYHKDLTGTGSTESKFCSTYPLVSYRDLESMIDLVASGEEQVLNQDRVLAFFKTSGTSSRPKLIPVTSSLLREKTAAFATYWSWIYQDYPDVKKGVLVSNFIDASKPEKTATGIDICSESNFWSSRGRSLHTSDRWPLPKEIRYIKHVSIRLYVIARLLLQTDVHCIMCLNPSTLLQFCRFVEGHSEELSLGLTHGNWGLHESRIIDQEDKAVLQGLEKFLKVDLVSVERLFAATSTTEALQIKTVWPSLQLAICWRSALVQPYYVQLEMYLTGIPMRDYISQSSECIMAIPFKDHYSGGALAYHSHFFEFIEENAVNNDNPKTLFAWELSIGHRYELVVTTGGGLTRYRTGDCILVKDLFGQIPIIEFLYRFGKTSSITGEKLTEHQIILAAEQASNTTGYTPHEFLCYPCSGELPAYRLLIESNDQYGKSDFEEDIEEHWAISFDQCLRSINTEYGDKCISGRLGPITTEKIPVGTLCNIRRQNRPESVSDEQIKKEVLSGELDWHLRFIPEVA